METGDKELAGLRNIINESVAHYAQRQEEYDRNWEFWTGRPRTEYKPGRRVKLALRVRGARTALACKIAPWLTDEY